MGTPEIVVKRACPCSSTFTPVGAPIGRSRALSIVGASVFSAQFFSLAEGWRFSKTSAAGFSAICGLDGFFSIRTPMFCCDDREGRARGQGASGSFKRPVGQGTQRRGRGVRRENSESVILSSRRIPNTYAAVGPRQGALFGGAEGRFVRTPRWAARTGKMKGILRLHDCFVFDEAVTPLRMTGLSSCATFPTLWRISTTRKPHGRDAVAGLHVHRESRGEKNSCR